MKDQRKKLLIAEMERAERRRLMQFADDFGFDAEAAPNGYHAIARYQQSHNDGRPFDLVLLTHHMLDITGVAALQILRATDPVIKAIIMSDSFGDPVLEDHRTYGFQAGLKKPTSFQAFTKALNTALQAP